MNELWRNGKIRLIVAGPCNLACFYCHNEGQDKHSTMMSLELVERVRALAASSVSPLREITISGGEPMLHPAIEEIINRLSSLGAPVTMVSNATLLTPSRIGDLRTAGLAKIRIGLDSLRLGKPRPSPGYLTDAPSVPGMIDAALAAGLPVELNTVLTKFNSNEIPELARFAMARHLSIKFFEHVEVDNYGTDTTSGTMCAKPHVSFAAFAHALDTAGIGAEFADSADLGSANATAVIGDSAIRYCRYLCPQKLCWTTGTRIDPLGYVYSCMVNRGLDRLPALPRNDATAIARAGERPCGDTSTSESGVPAARRTAC